jgi:hypothetical protein
MRPDERGNLVCRNRSSRVAPVLLPLLIASLAVWPRAATCGNAIGRPANRSDTSAAPAAEVPLSSLRLADATGQRQQATATIDGQTYAKALSIEQEYRFYGSDMVAAEYYLGKSYARFRSLVGVSDFASPSRALVYVVYGDGAELYRSRRLKLGCPPEPIDIPVTGVLRLKIQTEFSGPESKDDDYRAFWINPRVCRGGGALKPTVAKIILDGSPLVIQAPIVDDEPCIPLSVLRNLRASIRRLDWDAERGELHIDTR